MKKAPPSMWVENGTKETSEILSLRKNGLQALALQTKSLILKQQMPAPMFVRGDGEPGSLPSLQPKGILSDSSTISALSVDSTLNDTGSVSVPNLANAESEDTTVVDDMMGGEDKETSELDIVLAMMAEEEIRQKEEWSKFEEERKKVKKVKKNDRKQAEEDLEKKQQAVYAGWLAKNKDLRELLDTCRQHDKDTDALRVEEIEHDLAINKAQHESDAAALEQAKTQLGAITAKHDKATQSIQAKFASLKTAMEFAEEGKDAAQLANINRLIAETKAKEEKLRAEQKIEQEALAKAVEEIAEKEASSGEIFRRKSALLADSADLEQKETKRWSKWFGKKKKDMSSNQNGSTQNGAQKEEVEELLEEDYDDGRSVDAIYKDMQSKENLQRLAWDGMQKKQVELTEELDKAAKKGDRKKVEAIIIDMSAEKEKVDEKVATWELRRQLDAAQTRELKTNQGQTGSNLSKEELSKIKAGQIDAMQRKAVEQNMLQDLATQLEETRKQLKEDSTLVSCAESDLDEANDKWCTMLNDATDNLADLNSQLTDAHDGGDAKKEKKLIEQIRKAEETKAETQASYDKEKESLTKELSMLQTNFKANTEKSTSLKHLIEDLGQAAEKEDVTEITQYDTTPSDAMVEAAKPVKFKKWTKDSSKRPEQYDPNYIEIVPELSPQELVISQIKAVEKEQMLAWRQLELEASKLNKELERVKVEGGESLKVMGLIKELEKKQKQQYLSWQKANEHLKKRLDESIRRDQEMKKHYERVEKTHLAKSTNMLTFAQQEQKNEIKEQLTLLSKSLDIAQRNHDQETAKQISLSILRVEEGLRTLEGVKSAVPVSKTVEESFRPKGLSSPLNLASKAKKFFFSGGKKGLGKNEKDEDESGVLSDEEGEEEEQVGALGGGAMEKKGAVLQTQLNTLDQQLRALEKKRVESMTKYEAVNEVLMEEIEEQKLIRKMAKATNESPQDKMERRTNAKLVIDKLRDFKLERENTEKTFESHKLNIMGEMLKLRAQLFKNSSWKLGAPGKDGASVNGRSNIEDQAGGEMYELEDNGQFVSSPTNKEGSFKQNWEGYKAPTPEEYKRLPSTSPLRKRVTTREAIKANAGPSPIKTINLNDSMNSSVNLSLEAGLVPYEGDDGVKEQQDTAFSLTEALSGRAGSPSKSSMHLLIAMKTRAVPSITSVVRMGKKVSGADLNEDQRFNRASLDRTMRPLVFLARKGKDYATGEGLTGDLVDFLNPMDGEEWSAHSTSLMDLISIKAEVGLCPEVQNPPGKLAVMNALELVISGEESKEVWEWREGQINKRVRSGSRMLDLTLKDKQLSVEDRNALESIQVLQTKLAYDVTDESLRLNERKAAGMISRARMKDSNATKPFDNTKKKNPNFFSLDFQSNSNHKPGSVRNEEVDFTSPRKAKVLKQGYAVNHLNLSPSQAEELRLRVKDDLVLGPTPKRPYLSNQPNHMSPNIEKVNVNEAGEVFSGVAPGLVKSASTGVKWIGGIEVEFEAEQNAKAKAKPENWADRLHNAQTNAQKMRMTDGFNMDVSHNQTLRGEKELGRRGSTIESKKWDVERNKHRETAESRVKKKERMDPKFRTVEGILGELEKSVVDEQGNLLDHDYESSFVFDKGLDGEALALDTEALDVMATAFSYKLTPEEKSLKAKAKKAMARRQRRDEQERLNASKRSLAKKGKEVL
ncbi:hypothetical protein TrLO_g3953 [Triparma laevis f. longispina]|uniref:Uncharacterized protein n=1 Tax=Triparma laevis f. longispina TaxID=1714387 RepID=A0A9W7FTV1_9STRA|nr:hypothetical protein TrLO_g3953 [Triparma laevis f. longispina]